MRRRPPGNRRPLRVVRAPWVRANEGCHLVGVDLFPAWEMVEDPDVGTVLGPPDDIDPVGVEHLRRTGFWVEHRVGCSGLWVRANEGGCHLVGADPFPAWEMVEDLDDGTVLGPDDDIDPVGVEHLLPTGF